MPLIHPFTDTFTHQRRLAAMQGTNQLVRSDRGLGVLLRDTSTCPGWDRTSNPPTARRMLLPPEPHRPILSHFNVLKCGVFIKGDIMHFSPSYDSWHSININDQGVSRGGRRFANATHRGTGSRIPPLPRAEFGRLTSE